MKIAAVISAVFISIIQGVFYDFNHHLSNSFFTFIAIIYSTKSSIVFSIIMFAHLKNTTMRESKKSALLFVSTCLLSIASAALAWTNAIAFSHY